MGWDSTPEDFLKMMQVNKDLFGKEILCTNAHSEQHLIYYFEKKLSEIMNFEIIANSKYFTTLTTGKGEIAFITLKQDGFGLNIERCIKIFDYIYGRVRFNRFNEPELHWADTIIVLNYIESGYRLDKNDYIFQYKRNR